MTKGQKSKLNKLLAEACRLRDGYKCLRCGKTSVLQTSHIYPKGKHRRLEYDLDNVKTLCSGCHLFWWHRSPVEAWEWLSTTISPARLQRLKKVSNSRDKVFYDINYYNNKKDELEAFIRQQKENGI